MWTSELAKEVPAETLTAFFQSTFEQKEEREHGSKNS